MAGIGLAQMRRYEGMLARCKEIIERYDATFKPLGIEVLPHYTDSHDSSGHLYITRVPGINLERQGVAFSRTEDGHIAQRRFGGHTLESVALPPTSQPLLRPRLPQQRWQPRRKPFRRCSLPMHSARLPTHVSHLRPVHLPF